MNYTPLFQPISVGPLRLKNRFVMAPMLIGQCADVVIDWSFCLFVIVILIL